MVASVPRKGMASRALRRPLQRALVRADDRLRRLREIRHGDWAAEQFAAFGTGSLIEPPLALVTNPQSIVIGRDVRILPGAVLEAVHPTQPVLMIGDGSYIARNVRMVAINGIHIHSGVAIGHGTTISDTIHEYKRAVPGEPAWKAPLKVGRPLVIESGAWIGNLVIMNGGITIGEGAIVNALTFVARDVPAYTMVSGNPARALRRRNADGEWEWLVDPTTMDLDPDARVPDA